MARVPRKEVGWVHTVEPPHEDASHKAWTVWGPSLLGRPVCCFEAETADLVAAALNLAHNFHYIQRRVEEVAGVAEFFKEFK